MCKTWIARQQRITSAWPLFATPVLVSLTLLLFLQAAVAQNSYHPFKDPAAVAALNACFSAGNEGGVPVQDLTAVGDITYFLGRREAHGQATIHTHGLDQLRMDVTVQNAHRSWIVNRQTLMLKKSKHDVRVASEHSLLTSAAFTSLKWKVSLIANSPVVSVRFIPAVVNGHSAYEFQLQAPWLQPSKQKTATTPVDTLNLFVDRHSCQLLETEDEFFPTSNPNEHYRHEFFFDDFRTTNGINVPYTIIESFAGQTTWMLRLNSVSANSGMSAADTSFEP